MLEANNPKSVFNGARKRLSILVVAVSIIVAGFLVLGGEDKNNLVENNNFNERDQRKGFSLDRDGEKLNTTEGEDLSRFLTSQTSKLNLTQEFARRTASSINQNNDGEVVEGASIIFPGGENFVSESIDIYRDELSVEDKLVKLEELVVSGDNSAEAIISYFTQVKEMVAEYGQKNDIMSDLTQFSKNFDAHYIMPTISNFNDLIGELKKIKVPSDFIALHKRVIDLHITQKEVFGAMLFAKEDPLRASIILPMLIKTQEDFEKLTIDFTNEMRGHGVAVK